MGKIVGIDVGGSTTKIIGFDGDKLFSPLLVKATDPVSSVYGAFGRFLTENQIQLAHIDRIMVTGVGSTFINEKVLGIPTYKVDEFLAIGLGGLFLSGLAKAVIVSMGTGTAFVMAENGRARHLGGSGVGGGTLLGLSNRMLNVRNFSDIVEMAKSGDLKHVDLSIGDISHNELVGMPEDTTASNFGKMIDLASKDDIALGIINMVFQTIGMLAIFCARNEKVGHVVLTGNLTNVPQSQEVFEGLTRLHGMVFHIPENAEFATAVGAALIDTGSPSAKAI